MNEGHSHKAGALKQSNKAHKGGKHHVSAREAKRSGKAATKSALRLLTQKAKKELGRNQRRHQASQIRKNKREEVLNEKRKIGGLGTNPFLVCILPLNRDHDPDTIINLLMQCDPESNIQRSPQGVTHICIPRFKHRYSFIVPSKNGGNELGILDALKVSDTVVMLASAVMNEVVDDWGKNILMAAFTQGLPTPIIALTDMESIPLKKKHDCKKCIEKSLSQWFPDEKLYNLEKESEAMNLFRKIGEQKRRSLHYRDKRPHMYAEDVEFVPHQIGALGTLKVTGFLRGGSLNVNRLVHLPGLGDYQMLQVDNPPDPYKVGKDVERRVITVLERCNPALQESLESEIIPEPMDAEQTWPTNEEIELARQEQKSEKEKRITGWSDYQSAWMCDDLDSDVEGESEDENKMEFMPEEESEESEIEDYDIMTQSEVPGDNDKYDKEMDLDAEHKDLEMLKNAKSDVMFPDEIDTPVDHLAKLRFEKYRGLESFRTSPWDPYENLPSDYQRIYQEKNFERARKNILKDIEEEEGVLPGWYITVHIKDVSELAWNTFKETGLPLILVGMFPLENKMTVVNTVLKRTSEYGLPIKSKSKLIFQCGYRRFSVCPIFNEHTNGQKHKFLRYFQPDSLAVATFFAPLQFPPAPVLCYKEINDKLVLVAAGNLLSCNSERIILKRIVLSGHPFKIHKKSAVIRFMFFNTQDINHFKPVKLRTKMGRHSHIKEPLGTHGHMKCIFDGQLKSQDTVLMNLYKRVYPKWNYEELVVTSIDPSNMDL